MLKKLLAFICLTLSICANATPITWALNDVVFDNGGTATGSFTYDADLNLYTDVDVSTYDFFFGGDVTYNGLLSYPDGLFPEFNAGSATHVIFGIDSFSPTLSLNFERPLAVPGEMVAILPTSEEHVPYFYQWSREVTQGYVSATEVPLPATVWLVSSALVGLVGIGRRKKA